MIRVVLPFHLRALARVQDEITLEIKGKPTQASLLDALEARYPMLCGTVRDHTSGKRRPFLRFYACGEDLSHQSPNEPLPDPVVRGHEPFLVIGSVAGG